MTIPEKEWRENLDVRLTRMETKIDEGNQTSSEMFATIRERLATVEAKVWFIASGTSVVIGLIIKAIF